MKYRFMHKHSSQFPVKKMASVLEVSRSGFYAWLRRPPSRRERENRCLDVEIKAVYESSKRRYGSVKVTRELHRRGRHYSRKRVAERMKKMGLRSKVQRKFRVTTHSRHSYPLAPNLLNRHFRVAAPNQVWVSDITYIWTHSGWLYLTMFIDLFSRLVIGWAVSTSLSHEMVLQALYRAIGHRRPPRGLMVHSDRGIQYACGGFTDVLAQHGFIQSMSRKGDCWDNAVAESFFRTLKTELVYHVDLFDKQHLEKELFEYIEIFYNRQRIHSTLGYLCPTEYEQVKLNKCA